ncbi:hypothetical protein N2152v2_008058 [Parachlorella kessleri]
MQTLAQKLCDGTTGSGKDVNVTEAQSTFYSAIQAGGQKAVDGVAALMYAQLNLTCWEGFAVVAVARPPPAKMRGSSMVDYASDLLQHYTNVTNAAEYAGMGLCATVFTMERDDDTTREVLDTVHTGPGE